MNNLIFELKNIVDENKERNVPYDVIQNLLKGYLHYFVLDFIYNSPNFRELNFYGGSALRVLYDLPRLSEDIDFEADKNLNLQALASGLEYYFKTNLALEEKFQVNKMRTINRIFLKFPVLYEIGLSPHKNEVLLVKVEVRPLAGRSFRGLKTTLTPISKYGRSFIAKHYDLPTLFATKIPAILNRTKQGFKKGRPENGINFKGRDFYDLIWYMEQGILPDKKMLKKRGIEKPLKDVFHEIEDFIENNPNFAKGLLSDLRPLFASEVFVEGLSKNFLEIFKRLRKEKYAL